MAASAEQDTGRADEGVEEADPDPAIATTARLPGASKAATRPPAIAAPKPMTKLSAIQGHSRVE